MRIGRYLRSLLLGVLCFSSMHTVGAQLVDVRASDPLELFAHADTERPAESPLMPVGHFTSCGLGGHGLGCDNGCDSCGSETSCDAMGGCGSADSKCSCCKCREYMFGDLAGFRSCAASHGMQYRASLTQFYQGVTSGGAQREFRYGGKLDQYFDISTEGMGLWKGGLLEIHAPMLYGENSIFDAAAMAPSNTAFLIPRPNDLPVISITNFSYTQELGAGYAATAGKFDFLDLWAKFLPDYGKGIDGFMNTNSLIFLNVVPTLPTVFNGAGLIKAGEKGIEAVLFVIDPTTTSTVSGISSLFDNGTTILGAYRIYTNFGGLPGSHLAAGTYANRRYLDYDRNGWSFHPQTGLDIQKTGSWLGAYVGEQTLWQDRCNKNRKVWFLTTMGWADSKTSPYEWMGTFSIEAKGLSNHRQHDRMGISYFYSDVSDELESLVPAAVGLQDLQGGEIYYNAEINPWFHLTGDLQVVQTEIASQDTAVVLGVRAKLDF